MTNPLEMKNINCEEFRKKKYYKVVNAVYGIPEIHLYRKGLNTYEYTDVESFDMGDGMFICDIRNLFYYINYGPLVLEFSIPEDAKVGRLYMDGVDTDNGEVVDEYYADSLIYTNAYHLNKPEDVNTLLDLGADPFINSNALFIWALLNNENVFELLQKRYGIDTVNKIIKR